MQLLICVLNDTEKLPDFLAGLHELGIGGGTVIESQRMKTLMSTPTSVSLAIRHLRSGRRPYSYTVLSVVHQEEVATRALEAIAAGDLPATGPGHSGVAFRIPVTSFAHLNGSDQTVSRTFQLEAAMLAALRELEPVGSGLLQRLRQAFSKARAHPLTERRSLFRIPFQAELSVDSVAATLVEVGLTGLTLLCSKPLKKGALVEIAPPSEHSQSRPATCVVRYCASQGEKFRVALTLDPGTDALRGSWVAELLSALGYDATHLVQRREHLRVDSDQLLTLRHEGRALEARLVDLGMGGAAVQTSSPLAPDQVLEVEIEGVPTLRGQVLEQRNDLWAIRFLPLSKDRYEGLSVKILSLMGQD